MSDITLFGIPNCDTVKKARRWLDQREIAYRFHDFRKDGLTPAQVNTWLKQVDWEALLNKRGRTWRDLPTSEQAITNATQAVALCCKHPTVIKRPVLVSGKQTVIGFDPDNYARLFTA
ncbi:MAG: ArsC family reductase [Gammaproteobacteria bacterium]|nr:ArsC family reductase [Gammaproteobacteria bacterium]